MKRALLILTLLAFPLTGQSATPLGTSSNPPVVKSGVTLTIQSGATIIADGGSTIIGFGSGSGGITSGTSGNVITAFNSTTIHDSGTALSSLQTKTGVLALQNFSSITATGIEAAFRSTIGAANIASFNQSVSYIIGDNSSRDDFIAYLVDSGLEDSVIDTRFATLPVFTIDFNPLTITSGDSYYGEVKRIGDGTMLLFDNTISNASGTAVHWDIAGETDNFITIGISDSPTKQQIINKLVALGGGKITDLTGLKISCAPTNHDLEPIKFTVPGPEINAGFTYLGAMTGSSGFTQGNNNVGILIMRDWVEVGAFAHLTIDGYLRPTVGYKSADGTSGTSATTGGGTFKNGLYTGGTIGGGISDGAILGTGFTFPQNGLKIKGASSNTLSIKPNETLSAARILNVIVNNADRTFTLVGNFTVNNSITLSSDGTGTRTLGIGAGGTLGTAAFVATGTTSGTVPLLGAGGHLSNATVPLGIQLYDNAGTPKLAIDLGANRALMASDGSTTQVEWPTAGIVQFFGGDTVIAGDVINTSAVNADDFVGAFHGDGSDLTGVALDGAIGSSGLTMSTAKLLGRSTASTGAIEEITLGTNLSFSGTTLNAAGGGSSLPVADTTSIVQGSSDATKLLRLEVDGFTTTTTRVLTPPNYDGTIATLAGTETFTNKTLTAPALGTPVSGVVTNLTGTASININGTVGATTPTTGVFTTGVFGSTTSILLGTAGSAVGNIGFRNATSGTITLAPPTGALGTVTTTLPLGGTLSTLAGTETFTNKTITAPTISAPIISSATASTPAFYDGSKTLISGVAGTDYIAVTGTPTAGQVPIASSGTAAAWGSLSYAASGSNADITATTALNTITAAASTNLSLNSGSSGANLSLVQGTNGGAVLTTKGTGLTTFQSVAISGDSETVAKFTVSDASDYISIFNNNSTDGKFDPSIKSYTSRSNGFAFGFIGSVLESQDTGTTPLIYFQGRRDNATAVVNRPLFEFDNYGTVVAQCYASGGWYFGTTPTDPGANNVKVQGTLAVTGASTLTGGIVGKTDASNATAGNVGEYVSASVVQGSATALTTATPKTVTSISLTAGDWDVTGIGAITGASTGTAFDVAIGTTTNSFTGTVLGDTRCETPTVSLTGADATLMIPSVRVSISGTTTYYLVVQEVFTIGSPAAYGRMSARRVR